MRFLFWRLVAWFAAVALLPACWAASVALARALPAAFLSGGGAVLVPEGWALAGGGAAYGLWHRFRPPEFLYTFAHEMTHLLFALLLGKRVSRLEVSRQSGQVALSGTNFLITLAPYFFPLLAAVVLATGALAEWALGDGRVRVAAAFLTGMALAFHLVMTVRTLRTAQPDIQRSGRLFSWVLIYLAGLVFVGAAALAAGGGGRALAVFARALAAEGTTAYAWAAARVAEAATLLLEGGVR